MMHISRLILGLHPANERRRYKVTPSLIGLELALYMQWTKSALSEPTLANCQLDPLWNAVKI